ALGGGPARGRPAGRRLGRPWAGPGRVLPPGPVGSREGGGGGRGRPGRRRVPRRPGRLPARRAAGVVTTVRDLSPAGPHVLRRLPGRAGGGPSRERLAGSARRPRPLAGFKPGRAVGRGRPAAASGAAGRSRAAAPA